MEAESVNFNCHPNTLIPPPPQVSKERIRVLEFMRDYDKLRSGRIPLTSFRRALDIGGFELSQEEVDALKDRWVGVRTHCSSS